MVEVTAQDAQVLLHERLQAAGVDPQAMTVAQFWPVWKAFAGEDFGFNRDEDADGFLVEYHVPSSKGFTEPPKMNFVRQFTYDDDAGLYHHMEQMYCAFCFNGLLDDPEVASVILWSFGMPLDGYFAQVEALPVFRAALANAPVSVEWWTGEI